MRLKINKAKLLISVMVLSAMSLTGCATSDMKALVSQGNAVSTTGAKVRAANPNRVKIYYSNADLPKHYKIVGRVSVDNYNMVGMTYSQASIAEELKKQAASIGATGVINVNPSMTQTLGDAIINR